MDYRWTVGKAAVEHRAVVDALVAHLELPSSPETYRAAGEIPKIRTEGKDSDLGEGAAC